ncbi:BRO family protein [Aggregatibacter actinomycetemcomitans]|uniref:BRO family protein n=1 Tax=Aggregatibacter actinomycetemcomitans TaxID=714 RepID=UPI0011D40A7E|nr:BRO family protein [Aggregatibacter actinomycetemcomitans]TYA16849.1 phage repressor protein/antirepressor Ant [Aggregatibacter actinomycetemcomitans]TYB02312.1 phage repressor protein/antirepressor Ant [Aggregatibacter actinomycetemcomitans]TYB16756.1 phage repressor protein/antirepressor Ant [Aggregatibacter actinomycetemcomitans]TYB17726.1 phage repressor protein/antirepressor Ant [Aggregatibacter actinomycetemcomitans]TYB26987.1 phage repressor protein/antirepressor Ant [Aggregatibacter
MKNQTLLSTFNFESNSIRTLAINNEPWFVAKDLCNAINISNYRDAIERLDEDEKGVALTDTLGGQQEMNIINEIGMYTLILRCRDAVKKGSVPHRFRKWVTAEVLPAIRKTGKYEAKTTADDRTGLRNAVNMLVSKKGLIYSDAYNLVHQYMNVERIEDIPADKLQSAVEYVHRIVLEGELITDTSAPQPKNTYTVTLTEYELQTIAWACFAFRRNNNLLHELYSPLAAIGSKFAVEARDNAVEYRNVLRRFNEVVKHMTDGIAIDPETNWRVIAQSGCRFESVLPYFLQ